MITLKKETAQLEDNGETTPRKWSHTIPGDKKTHEIHAEAKAKQGKPGTFQIYLMVLTTDDLESCSEIGDCCIFDEPCQTREECINALIEHEGLGGPNSMTSSSTEQFIGEAPEIKAFARILNSIRLDFFSQPHTPLAEHPELKQFFEETWALEA